jgi:hypothetical protein
LLIKFTPHNFIGRVIPVSLLLKKADKIDERAEKLMRIVYKDIVKKQAVFEAKVEEKFTSFFELLTGYQKRTEEVIIAMKAD